MLSTAPLSSIHTHSYSPRYSGVMVPPKDQVTVQGYDLQFGTNVLGTYT